MEKVDDLIMQVVPNRSVGFMTLGASLHEILTHLKAQPSIYPSLELTYSPGTPIDDPVLITLARNGMRLRFDGPDQRLRLIEVLDFTKTRYTYKETEIVKAVEGHAVGSTGVRSSGPRFRHVYDKLLGPTFAGEYIPPPKVKDQDTQGTYVLSYPGIAFSFPLRHSAYSPDKDFISLLSSSATSPATSMSIFNGDSWPTVCDNLYVTAVASPRSLSLAVKGKEEGPDEIELVRIMGEGRIELVRRSSPAFEIVLGETTPQDLVTELGAPDSIYRKQDRRLSIHKERTASGTSENSVGILSNVRDPRVMNTSNSIFQTDDEDSDEEDEVSSEMNQRELASAECFFNYYSHGFDVLIAQPSFLNTHNDGISSPTDRSSPNSGTPATLDDHYTPINHLAVTKIIFHGNVPGSYQFNRHRRSRWTLEHVTTFTFDDSPLTSEMPFGLVAGRLQDFFSNTYASPEEERSMQRAMTINRGWGESPGSSCEFLGGWEDSSQNRHRKGAGAGASERTTTDLLEENDMNRPYQGNTMLYGFPGLIFEVMESGAVCCLTVY